MPDEVVFRFEELEAIITKLQQLVTAINKTAGQVPQPSSGKNTVKDRVLSDTHNQLSQLVNSFKSNISSLATQVEKSAIKFKDTSEGMDPKAIKKQF